jgi:hypothetical protein
VLSAPYRDVQRQFGFYRSAAEQTTWAAHPGDFLGVSPRNRTYAGLLPTVWPEPLFPGFVVLGLGAVGLGRAGAALRRRARPAPSPPGAQFSTAGPSALGFYAGLAGLGVILSLGPTLDWGAIQVPLPYQVLSSVPGFSGLRSPVRLVVLAALGWGVLAGWGWRGVLAGVIRRLGPVPAARARLLAAPATVLLLGVLSWEQWTVLTPTTPLPGRGVVPPAYGWLADHPDGGVLAEFPAIAGLRDPTRTTTRMYYQGSHGHPLLNGYSSFIPPTYSEIVHQLDQDVAVTPQDIGVLQSMDVRYVLFNRPAYKKAHWQRIMRDMTGYPEARLIAQYGDEFHGDALYRLAPLPAAARLRLSGALPPRLPPGATVPLTVTISNSYRYALLTRLQPRLALEAAWVRTTGPDVAPPAAWPLRGEVDLPLVLPPGTQTFTTGLPAPAAGRWTLYLRLVAPAPAYPPFAPLLPVDAPCFRNNTSGAPQRRAAFVSYRHRSYPTPSPLRPAGFAAGDRAGLCVDLGGDGVDLVRAFHANAVDIDQVPAQPALEHEQQVHEQVQADGDVEGRRARPVVERGRCIAPVPQENAGNRQRHDEKDADDQVEGGRTFGRRIAGDVQPVHEAGQGGGQGHHRPEDQAPEPHAPPEAVDLAEAPVEHQENNVRDECDGIEAQRENDQDGVQGVAEHLEPATHRDASLVVMFPCAAPGGAAPPLV